MSNGSYVECAFPLDTHAPKEPKLRVFVFAFAGGQSWSLRSISAQLDASTTQVIEMEYPGHGHNESGELCETNAVLTKYLCDCIMPYTRKDKVPYAFLGHSMGTIQCIAITQAMILRRARLPMGLFVVGRGPPHVVDPDPSMSNLSDDEMQAQFLKMGSPIGEMPTDDEFTQKVYATTRADSKICDDLLDAKPQVPMPLYCYQCKDEKGDVDEALCRRWVELCRDEDDFVFHQVSGDHMACVIEPDHELKAKFKGDIEALLEYVS